MQQFAHAFFNDQRVQILLLLVALDLVLGVAASLFASAKAGRFGLVFLADFARNDLLAKVLPFAAIYAGYLYAKHATLVIPGFNMEVAMDAMWALVLAALVASLLGSLKQFGISQLPDVLAGPDPQTPSPNPSPNP